MNPGAAALGWSGFIAGGLAAAVSPPDVQFAYASLSIALLGLPHGASDLALIPRHRRISFVAAYLVGIALLLIWWKTAPFAALVTLLILSAVHFGIDDAPAARPMERLTRGVMMIAGPALLHRAELSGLFAVVTGERLDSANLATVMAGLALVAALVVPSLILDYWQRGDRHGAAILAGGVLALVLLPPLVGFAIGFLVLHARRQLRRRMIILGYRSVGRYLRAMAPILAGAAAVLGAVVVLFARGDTPGAPTLFAGIAALAIPHMLVTPLWATRRVPRDWQRWGAEVDAGGGLGQA